MFSHLLPGAIEAIRKLTSAEISTLGPREICNFTDPPKKKSGPGLDTILEGGYEARAKGKTDPYDPKRDK